jgi:methyl-accepting chemotaxis protein
MARSVLWFRVGPPLWPPALVAHASHAPVVSAPPDATREPGGLRARPGSGRRIAERKLEVKHVLIDDMKTGTKVAAGFGLALLITLVVGAVGLVSARGIGTHLDDVANHKFPSALMLAEIVGAQARVARGENALLLAQMTDPEIRRGIYEDMDRLLEQIEGSMRALEALPRGEQARELFGQVRARQRAWERASRSLIDLIHARDRVRASKPAGSPEVAAVDARVWEAYMAARQEYLPLANAVEALVQQTKEEVDVAKKVGVSAVSSAAGLTAAAILVGAALVIAFGAGLSRSVSRAIRALLSEAGKLGRAVEQGRLDERGDAAALSSEFRPVLEGMNRTMDAFAKPMKLTAEYTERISLGDLPPIITESYEGDFRAIKSSLNHLIEMVQMRNADIRHLIDSALAGRLAERADTTKYKGANGKLLEGINGMLDAVLAPIQEAAKVLERLAQRDLRARMGGNYQGDHARIKDAVNATAQALHSALVQVAEVVQQVSSASDQIASSAQSVASGASEQASGLEETSSSLESMAAMTKQSTDNAQQANALAQQARSAATEGGAATAQMTEAMTKIRASAEGTSQIIKDINEIAFQTNLLALNAAVEAARAGEAGRGFAVVAEEVRSLALRSKEAANKTEALIRQSVKEAGEGEGTARQVAEQLSAIVGSIGKVSDIVAEIAASSKEQASGIDQVNQAVADVGKVTQQNAASAEQSSSAAAELSGQARQLAEMIATFQLEHGAARALRARAAPAAPTIRPQRAENGIAVRPEDVIPMAGELVPGEF